MSHQIKLGPQFENFVDEMIEKGRYKSVDEIAQAAFKLLYEQEKHRPGRMVELPENPSLSSLNTFMDDNLEELIAMLDAKESAQQNKS